MTKFGSIFDTLNNKNVDEKKKLIQNYTPKSEFDGGFMCKLASDQ